MNSRIIQITTEIGPENQAYQSCFIITALCCNGTIWKKHDDFQWNEVDTKEKRTT